MPAIEAKLLTLRVDEMNRQKNWMCGGAVCVTIIIVFVGFSLLMPALFIPIPPEDCSKLKYEDQGGHFCTKYQLNGVPIFRTYVMNVDKFNQYIHIRAVPMMTQINRNIILNKNITFTVLIEEVRDDYFVTKTVNLIKNESASITCTFTNSTTSTNSQECSKFTLVLLPQIDPGNYKISFQLDRVDELIPYISYIYLEGVQINSEYYSRYVAVRYIFFFISVSFMMVYLYTYFGIPLRLRSFEQNFMAFFSFSLCFYNDPLLYLNILVPSKFSIFLSTLCTVIYITAMFMFWIVLFPRISIENAQPYTTQMQLWKIVYMSVRKYYIGIPAVLYSRVHSHRMGVH